MNVCPSSERAILQPCALEGHTHQLDPYIGCEHRCSYCYALNDAETDWAEEILIHPNLVERLRCELSALGPQSIYIGWRSDPYQPAERTYLQTRQALEVLVDLGFSACLLTKSDLVVRDIELLEKMTGSSVGFSLAFQEERVRRRFEVSAPRNDQRVAALKKLKQAGIATYVLICPVMPFLTDVSSLIAKVAPYADAIWIYALRMETEKDRNWRNVQGILERSTPGMSQRYREIAFAADHPYWAELRQRLEELQRETQSPLRIEL
jgi:DNA repair photolyase